MTPEPDSPAPRALPARALPEAAAATAVLAGTGLVHLQGAATHLRAVEGLDGSLGVLGGHLDETEAAGAAGLAIVDQADALDLAVGGEEVAQLVLGGGVGQITDVDLRQFVTLSVPFAPLAALRFDEAIPHCGNP